MPPYIAILRPKQWIKSGFVFAPLLFALKAGDIFSWQNAAMACVSFICVSASVYIFNDIQDRHLDRQHSQKMHRPLASGQLQVKMAYILCFIVLAAGILITFLTLSLMCVYVLLAYASLQYFYCINLKDIAIIDVLVIAVGFVLRVLMGGFAIGVVVSVWMISAVFLLAFFLGMSKRYHEIMSEPKMRGRISLARYSQSLLLRLMGASGAMSLLCYILYVQDVVMGSDKQGMYITILPVAFGLIRYFRHVLLGRGGGEPEAFVFSDTIFLFNGLLWLGFTLWILAM